MTETVTLGETRLGRIGLGTNRLTHTPENLEFLRQAVAAGVSLIDTAHVYTGGESEETIGAALSTRPEGCLVATKGGYGAGNGRAEVLNAQVEQSLRRLRADRIDLYYLHKPDPETPLEESVGAIAEHVDRGRIRYVGLSNVSVEQIERARKVVSIAAVQNHYSLSEREHDDVLAHCEGNGIVFVTYFPLRDTRGPVIAEIAERHGTTPEQVALAWLLRRSSVTLPIPGTLSLDHLRENVAASQVGLTDEEFAALG